MNDNFWAAARAPNRVDINSAIEKIGLESAGAYSWLHKINPKHWSLHAFDHNVKCDHVTNNMTES